VGVHVDRHQVVEVELQAHFGGSGNSWPTVC
jgi:hypothetical protein